MDPILQLVERSSGIIDPTLGSMDVSDLEPFSGVEIHMEMDMEWKWMEMGHSL